MEEGENICGNSTFLQQVLALTVCKSVRLQNTAEILRLSPLGMGEPVQKMTLVGSSVLHSLLTSVLSGWARGTEGSWTAMF